MAKYSVNWEAIVQRSLSIEAESAEEAFKKWQDGDYEYSDLEVDDEDIHGESIEIDNVEYYATEFKRVLYNNSDESK